MLPLKDFNFKSQLRKFFGNFDFDGNNTINYANTIKGSGKNGYCDVTVCLRYTRKTGIINITVSEKHIHKVYEFYRVEDGFDYLLLGFQKSQPGGRVLGFKQFLGYDLIKIEDPSVEDQYACLEHLYAFLSYYMRGEYSNDWD